MSVEDLALSDRNRLTDQLMRVRAGLLTADEKGDLFDELADRFGHSNLAESLKYFGLK